MFQQNITSPKVILGAYLQRLSATFGFNNSPTTFELDLVAGGEDAVSSGDGATGFNFGYAYPGSLIKFDLGSLQFGGLVQSWTENFGPNGQIYSVRTVDPRIIFGNVLLNLDGRGLSTGVILDNYLNVFRYYGSPQAADSTADGMSFSKIRQFLETTGIVNAYNNKFRLVFASGFQDSSGSFNISGIPYWYRINASEISLDQLLQQVSQDFSMDYYVNVDYSNFNPTGTINNLYINTIYRTSNSDPADISGFIVNARNSGVLQSYRRGQELRSEPTTSVALGAPLEYWKCPQSNEIQCYWGRSPNGTAVTTELTDNYGIVLLDHISGSGSQYITDTVSVLSIGIVKSSQGVYPPRITKTVTTQSISGYQANSNVFRAALYNQQSWEEALYRESPTFARHIGVTRNRFLTYSDFLLTPSGIRYGLSLSIVGTGVSDRDPIREELIRAVYDATRSTAENYWGKSWIIKAGESNWLNSGSYDSSELIPRIEFVPSDFTWSELGRGTPSGATLNYPVIAATNNPSFRNEIGKIKSFVGIPNFNTNVSTSFPYPVDLNSVNRDSIIIDQGSKLALSLNIETYEKEPNKFIVNLPFSLEGITNGSGFRDQRFYYDFLKYVGYDDIDIRSYNLMQNAEDNEYGLASPRPFSLPISSDVYGFFLGIQRTEQNFGGFIASGVRSGGCKIIQDGSLAPWTYGGYSGFLTAGQTIVDRSVATATVIDSADISLVGLPPFNIGDSIGNSSQITNASAQFGPDGFVTNYSIRTFALPAGKLSKILIDKISNIYNKLFYQQKEILNLNRNLPKIEKPLLTPQQVNSTLGNPKKGPTSSTKDHGFIGGFTIPAVTGLFDPRNNPTIIYV